MNVRLLRLLEVPAWLTAMWKNRDKNDLNAKLFDYPTLKVVVAENGAAPIVYMPVHTGMVLDSMAWGATEDAEEKLNACKAIVDKLVNEAEATGIREIFFVSSDPRTDEAAAKHFGFREVKAYRKVL